MVAEAKISIGNRFSFASKRMTVSNPSYQVHVNHWSEYKLYIEIVFLNERKMRCTPKFGQVFKV